MNALIVLALAGIAGGIAYLTGKDKASFFKGQTRTISFNDGSKPEHLSRLRVIFSNVTDRGNGVYEVTSDFDGTITLPEGSTIAGVGSTSPIVLYAIFHRGRHIGFAFGSGPASAIKYVLTGSTYQKSNQKMPTSWASKWRPVWGNDAHTTIWGRFVSPYDGAIATYLRWAGYYASVEPFASTQDYLALRDY